MDASYESAVKIASGFFPELSLIPENLMPQVWEVRFYAGRPILLRGEFGWRFLKQKGGVSQRAEDGVILTGGILARLFASLCDYSVYSFSDELRQGFVTLQGGHRVGIGACAVRQRGEEVSAVKQVTSLCLRIAREKKGCAEELLREASWQRGILLAGIPLSGKTTLLRDAARILGNRMIPTALIDERWELSGGHGAALDTGLCTDVLAGFPKREGILSALRSLAPRVILCDEVGSEAEVQAIAEGMNAGVSVIAAIHAANPEELLRRRQGRMLLKTGAFQAAVFLSEREKGKIEAVYRAEELLKNEENRYYDGNSRMYRLRTLQRAAPRAARGISANAAADLCPF